MPMSQISQKWSLLGYVILSLCHTFKANAQAGPVTNQPQQIVPQFGEVGAGVFVAPVAPSTSGGNGTVGSSPTGSSGGSASYVGGSAMQQMMATSYGQTAVSTANSININPDAVAAIGHAESGFANIRNTLGTSNATGPFQIVPGTWGQTVSEYNLPYTAADITNPAAQAVVAPYIIANYAHALQQVTGTSPTIEQAYGSYVFGPAYGPALMSADPNAPLASVVSPTEAANNNMSSWTVGQFNTAMASRLGSAANQLVFTSAAPVGA